jgi:DNA-binding transcriptional regulator YiaG
MRTRPALPPRPIPNLIVGNDTRAQAAENQRRFDDYLSLLHSENMPLPGLPQSPGHLYVPQAAREAGLCPHLLRPGTEMRDAIDAFGSQKGYACIITANLDFEQITIQAMKDRLDLMASHLGNELGLKPSGIQREIKTVFDLFLKRSGKDRQKLAAPLLEQLLQDLAQDELPLGTHAKTILCSIKDLMSQIDKLETDGQFLSLADRIAIAVAKIGLPQTALARVIGVKQSTLNKWMKGEKTPNARSYPALQAIAREAGLREDFIVEKCPGQGVARAWRLSLDLFPPQYRDRNSEDLRKSVQAHLTEDDRLLGHAQICERLAHLCEDLNEGRKKDKSRKAMRDENKIDTSAFSPILRKDLATLESYYKYNKGHAAETATTYLNFIGAVLDFALSANAPAELRVPREEIRLSHILSAELWGALLKHRLEVGQDHLGHTFKVHRGNADRFKSILSLADPKDGFFKTHTEFHKAMAALGEPHRHVSSNAEGITDILLRAQAGLREQKKSWAKNSTPKTAGRYEITDLLNLPDPRIAGSRMIAFQHRIIAHLAPDLTKPLDDIDPMTLPLSYATGLRNIMLLHIFMQTGLRIGMLNKLTVGRTRASNIQITPGAPPTISIRKELFKNRNNLIPQDRDFFRELQDHNGFYRDLEIYMRLGRPRLLHGEESEYFFVADRAFAKKTLITTNVLYTPVRNLSRAAIGEDAPCGQRLIFKRGTLRPHHFRDILATYVLHASGGHYGAAADAIHVTEKTCREYYAYDSPEKRAPVLHAALSKAPQV